MGKGEGAKGKGSSKSNGATTGSGDVKKGLAKMLKGGVIMDVVTPEQARIAEEAGAVAVMALERIPADIRSDGNARCPGRTPAISSHRCSDARRAPITPARAARKGAGSLRAPPLQRRKPGA